MAPPSRQRSIAAPPSPRGRPHATNCRTKRSADGECDGWPARGRPDRGRSWRAFSSKLAASLAPAGPRFSSAAPHARAVAPTPATHLAPAPWRPPALTPRPDTARLPDPPVRPARVMTGERSIAATGAPADSSAQSHAGPHTGHEHLLARLHVHQRDGPLPRSSTQPTKQAPVARREEAVVLQGVDGVHAVGSTVFILRLQPILRAPLNMRVLLIPERLRGVDPRRLERGN